MPLVRVREPRRAQHGGLVNDGKYVEVDEFNSFELTYRDSRRKKHLIGKGPAPSGLAILPAYFRKT